MVNYISDFVLNELEEQHIIFGFHNTGNSCYINATMQCLLNLRPIRNILKSDDNKDEIAPLKAVFNEYGGPIDLSTEKLSAFCHSVHKKYISGRQQDVTDFIDSIFSKYPSVKKIFNFEMVFHTACPNSCIDRNQGQLGSTMYKMNLPPNKCANNVRELLDWNLSQQIKNVDGVWVTCSICEQPIWKRRLIRNTSNALILYLGLAKPNPHDHLDWNQKTTDFKLIERVPDQTIEIDGKVYEFAAAIFHHGIYMVHDDNHYTAIIRNGDDLISANDGVITPCEWPENSKDLSVIFYIQK